MAPEKKSLHEEAVDLLSRVNGELKGNEKLSTINVKMVGVVKDLNDIMIAGIIGGEAEIQEK